MIFIGYIDSRICFYFFILLKSFYLFAKSLSMNNNNNNNNNNNIRTNYARIINLLINSSDFYSSSLLQSHQKKTYLIFDDADLSHRTRQPHPLSLFSFFSPNHHVDLTLHNQNKGPCHKKKTIKRFNRRL
jgi:hypothetical protein